MSKLSLVFVGVFIGIAFCALIDTINNNTSDSDTDEEFIVTNTGRKLFCRVPRKEQP